ncbi:MAG: HK97 family phage prohead protease [Flavobacteriaceae bacterium]|nr:HK97 family phage prohead protease [Flavobacteriaceae bacterium]|tara:strand:- start:15360 stop:15977 length:618 start_codon:yes stop_codon:yes gene_type:complete
MSKVNKTANEKERRFFDVPVTFEARNENDTNEGIIEGYAALYESRTNLGWMEEEILPGAFDDVVNDDVRCLINHDPQYILARSNNGQGTLTLTLDARGLKYSYKTPNRSYAKDLEDAIRSGDVSQSSFAFSIKEEEWIKRDGQPDLRKIKKFERLYDVSPVTFPAYADTTVAKRSFEETNKPQVVQPKFDEYEARHRVLTLKSAK